MKTDKEKRLIQFLTVSTTALVLSGCNIKFDWEIEVEVVPTGPEYSGKLEASTPELTAMLQKENLNPADLPYLANSTVIYYQDPVFDLTGQDNRIRVDSSTGEIYMTQTFSVDSGSDPKTLVDSTGYYNYEGDLNNGQGGPMTCKVSIKMAGQWDDADQTLTGITGEISNAACSGGNGGQFSGDANVGNVVVFLDDAMDLNSDGAGGYIDGEIRFKYGLLDLPPNDPAGPIAFEFEATTTLVP